MIAAWFAIPKIRLVRGRPSSSGGQGSLKNGVDCEDTVSFTSECVAGSRIYPLHRAFMMYSGQFWGTWDMIE